MLLSGWLNIYGALLIGIYRLMQKVGWQLLGPVVVMELGVVVLTVSYLVMLAGAYHLGPLYQQGASREALYGAEYLRKSFLRYRLVYGSWLMLGLSPALFGAFGLKSEATPKWISRIALGGVLSECLYG